MIALHCVIRPFCFLPVAQCQAAWADQWVEVVFSNALTAIRRTCFTSLFTRLRSLILTRTVRPRPRIRNLIVVSRRLTVAPPRRRDNLLDQEDHPTNRRLRPRPVSSRLISSCSIPLLSRLLKMIWYYLHRMENVYLGVSCHITLIYNFII